MTSLVQYLEWDTEFFGFPIGQVDLNGANAEGFERIEAEARDLGLHCLYGALEPTHIETAQLAQSYGHRLIDVAITLCRPAIPFEPRPTEARARRGTLDDIPALEDAIATMIPWSRFGADPRFSDEDSFRLLKAWAERAAGETDKRMLAVVEDDSGLIGLSTQVRSPVPRVDYMAVTKPRSGAAWALMAELVEWGGGSELEGGPCMARNVAPIRYLEHCGFSSCRAEYRYHRWLDEGRGVDA